MTQYDETLLHDVIEVYFPNIEGTYSSVWSECLAITMDLSKQDCNILGLNHYINTTPLNYHTPRPDLSPYVQVRLGIVVASMIQIAQSGFPLYLVFDWAKMNLRRFDTAIVNSDELILERMFETSKDIILEVKDTMIDLKPIDLKKRKIGAWL